MGLWLLAILLTVVILKAKPDFARLWWLYALMAFAFCAVLLPSFFVQASVLHERGVRDVAVVNSAQASGDSERMYRLSTSDGRPIAGWFWAVQLGGGLAFVVLAAGWFRSVGRAGSRRRES